MSRLIGGGGVVEGLQVVAAASPNMSVYVQAGSGAIATGTYPSSYSYLFSIDTASPGENVTIGTAAASPRIDYIVAYIDKIVTGDHSGSIVNNSNNVLKLADVQGTPAGSPTAPTVSQIQSAIGAANPYIILAQIAVAGSATQITNPNITDKRTFGKVPTANINGGTAAGVLTTDTSGNVTSAPLMKNATGSGAAVTGLTNTTYVFTAGMPAITFSVAATTTIYFNGTAFLQESGTSGVIDLFAAVHVDGTKVGNDHVFTATAAGNGGNIALVGSATLTAGSHTIDIRTLKASGTPTMTIFPARSSLNITLSNV